MIQTSSKIILTAAVAMLLSSTGAFANREVRRIDHPNGIPTFVAKPSPRTTTVAVYANEQGVAGPSVEGVRRGGDRPVKIHRGRGQYIHVRGK